MKRLLILTTVLAFVLGSMALATETRVLTMGDVNNIVKDDANITLFPSTINYYPNMFVGEIGDSYGGPMKDDYDEMSHVGVNWQFGAESDNPWVLGIYFSDQEYYHWILDKTEEDADHRIDLYYGRNLGDMPFGFHLGYYGDGYKNEDDEVTNNYEESLKRYEFGFGLSPMEGKMDIALQLGFVTWTDQDYRAGTDAVVDITKPSGNMDFSLIGRYFMDPKGKYILVPHAGLMYDKQGAEYYGVEGTSNELQNTYTYTELAFELGMGINYEASEDVLVVSDFGFAMMTDKYENEPADGDVTEDKDTDLVLPYFKAGIDAKVLKWLDFRAGAMTAWYSSTYEPGEGLKRKSGGSSTMTYLGAGLHWGDLEIDAWVDPSFLTNGPYFISGEDTDGDFDGLAARVSLLYWFD